MRPARNRPRAAATLELWGGVECTVNRVGDCYFDQIERTGHSVRIDDLDRFAALGIRALRYPILWERIAPHGLAHADWTWADQRLRRMRRLGVRPIAGLVHHGSGPRHTSLIDPGFAGGLAEYAQAVARRYPWVRDYTPVNEPLTTARFSGLYGHWYPHRRDGASFVRALLVQCRATVMAMRAIREVTPGARLIQTEDIGTTFSTATLAYQAEHENLRRLLSLDLLCGRVDRNHPLWRFLRDNGATRRELTLFLDAPAPPNIIGINYYVTSDRVLDQRLAHYPAWSHGGNGRAAYADVEAARSRHAGITGQLAHLRALWARYRRPLAITEVHMGATREQQLRWLDEAWQAARRGRDEGIDVRAVTLWALLGSLDWNQLVVRADGFYESGAFDVRSAPPRPTALAAMARALASGQPYEHPALPGPGWWRRRDRLQYGPHRPQIEQVPRRQASEPEAGCAPPLVIAGATGALGQAFARICALRGLTHQVLARDEMDIADAGSVHAALDRLRPWAVVNAAGYARVDTAEHESERCRRENTCGALVLAEVCRERAVRLLTFSSDFVFDGAQARPYVESDRVGPLSVYGASKAEAERGVLATLASALVVRSSGFFGPWDERNFLSRALREMSAGQRVRAAADATFSPTYLPDLVHTALDLLIDGERGVWHLANRGAVSWADLVRLGADLAGVRHHLLDACATAALGLAAPRPAYSVLGSERGALLPSLEEALQRFACEHAIVRGRT